MQSDATTVEEYLASLPEDRRAALTAVRKVINGHLPEGYVEKMDWGMISWVVPLETKPDTYNNKPLCYLGLASQKQHMSLYLMGLYTDGPELDRFQQQYADRGLKLDMGKSCVRFKQLEDLPLDVVGETVAGISVDEYVARYEASRGAR